MEEIRGIDALLSSWDAEDQRVEWQLSFRRWRGDHLSRHREFSKLKQREMGAALGLSQAMYAKFEQANTWGVDRTRQIADLLKVPMAMLHNQAKARAFFSRDGGLTYIKLLEGTMERWNDEGEGALGQIGLPVVFIRERLDSESLRHPNDERPARICTFMKDPLENDLDQPTKRWLEKLLDLPPGTLVDTTYNDEKRADRRTVLKEMRRHFLTNVARLLEERRWTPADLATYSGLPMSEVADADGKLLFQPLRTGQIAGISVAFDVDYFLLIMQNGTDMQRESAAALQDLPASVRSFIGWLHRTVTESRDGDGHGRDGGVAVTAMLPLVRAMLEQLHRDATRRPQVAEAMSGLFHAYDDRHEAIT